MTTKTFPRMLKLVGKKICLALIALAFICFLGNSAFAERVGFDKAKRVTSTFLKAREREKQTKPYLRQLAPARAYKMTVLEDPQTKEVLGYIMHIEPKGFVFISADTNIQPIIAYSYESNFSLKDVPENVLLYMSRKDMKNRLNAIPVIDENIKKTNSQLWEAYSLGSEAFMQELQAVNQWPQGDNAGWLKTRWHQGNPNSPDDNYNQSCPVDPNMTNLRSHVGCAAVAMGQIVWYWQHPSSISFNDSDKYTSRRDPDDGDGERIIEIDGDSITYDFPSFATLNSRLSEINYDVDGPDINPDIPDLLFACGIIQHMGYSSAGSGAFLESSHFTDKLNYWHAAKLEESGNPQFYDLLQSNMKKCKPALLVIYTENWLTGHAIVADGYKENGDFHLNWGWGSSQPDPITGAWYNLPQGMPAEFTIVDYGIVNIIPTSNFSTKFKTGDNVRVASTILKIHNAPAGDEKTTLTKGSLGKVWADEGIYRELGGIGYRWWYVQMVNEGDGQTYTGWCAESGLEKTTPSLTITAGLVIDRSGSMNSSDRLPVAKSAAGYFVDASEAGDEMAISAFDYEPLLVSALTGITKTDPTNNSTKDSLKNDINALTTRKGKTNFGAGLQEVYNQLITSTKNQPTVAVFMSDGKHNIPSEDPSDYQPQIDLFKNKGWPIYTVGFGSDADEGRLKQIASQTGGQYYSGAANLTQLYSLIQTAMKGQSVMAAISGYLYGLYTIFRSLPIFDPTITYVKFLLSWPGSELDLVLISPDGTEIDPLMAASDPDIDYYKTPTYAYYTLNNPSAGEWRVKITGVDIPVGGEEYAVTVIASSPVISNMPGFKSGYAVGENIDIGLILREQTGPQTSIPITGANVLADVTRPDAVTDRLTLYDDGSHNDSLANDGIYGYEYTNTGTEGFYEILITAEGPGGTFTRQLQQTVEIGQAAPPLIAADFSGSPVTGCVPLTVNFSDSSTGGILSYLWDFGDGTTSAAKNPTHTYTNPGDYTVSLTVSGAAGSDAETRTGYITVNSCLSQLYLSKFSDPWGDSDCSTLEVYKGAVITYFLNYGCESDAGAANAIVVDYLDWGLTVVDAGGGSYDYAAHTLTWNLGQINNEDTGTGNFLFFAAEVTADSGDCIENYAHISADNAGTFGSEFITHRVTEPLSLTANAGADGSICFGDWCPILDGSATGGTPPYTYSWFPITGLDNPHTASPSACPDTTTTYTLTVIDTNGYSAQDQATVEVCPLDGWEYPMSTYYHDARTQTICLSNEIGPAGRITSLALDVIIVPGQTMEAWTIRMKHTSLSSYPGSPEWEGSGWTVVYQADEKITSTGWNTFAFSTPFEYNGSDNLLVDYSFNNSSYTSDGYCRYSTPGGNRSIYYRSDSEHGDPLAWSGTNPLPGSIDNVPDVKFTVEELSTTAAYFSATPTTGCAPLTVNFSDSSTGDVLSYLWDLDGDGRFDDASVPNPTYSYTNPGTYTVSLMIILSDGSSDSETKTDYITVNSSTVTADFSATPTTGCAPLEVSFNDSSIGDIASRYWNFGDGTASMDPNPIHTYDNPGTYTISLTVFGLPCSNTETKYITVNLPPTANAGSDVRICQGTCTTLTGSVSGGTPGYAYLWTPGNMTGRNPNVCPTTTTTYTLTVTDNNGCANDDQVVVTVNQDLIAADFGASPISDCVPLTVNFSDSSTGAILSYLWDFGDGTTGAAQNPTHTYTNPGDYTVSLTISDTCGSDTKTRTDYITVKDYLIKVEPGQVKIQGGERGYVNPAKNEYAKIIFEPEESGKVAIRIYTLRGRLVWKEEVSVNAGVRDDVIWPCENVSGERVASGTYLVHIKGAGIDVKKKIVVIK